MQYILNQDTLDMSGAEITVYYSDGSTTTVSVTNEMVTGFDNTYVGTQLLTINYQGHYDGFQVAIVESEDKPLLPY